MIIVYLLFQFLLDYFIVSDFTVVMAVLTDPGHLGPSLGPLRLRERLPHPHRRARACPWRCSPIINFLASCEDGGGAGDALRFIGLIIYWIAGLAAGYGAWLVFRLREDVTRGQGRRRGSERTQRPGRRTDGPVFVLPDLWISRNVDATERRARPTRP